MEERWLPVVDYEGFYEVSDQGRVRSVDRVITRRDGRTQRCRSTVLVQCVSGTMRYPSVHLCRDGGSITRTVHTLMLESFEGPRPKGWHGCHGDGKVRNNVLSNLRWDTPDGNARDKLKHGTHPQAAQTHCKRGHEFTPENTYINPASGGRVCRACHYLRHPLKGPRTRCRRGHERNAENTYINPSTGKPICRPCKLLTNQLRRERLRRAA